MKCLVFLFCYVFFFFPNGLCPNRIELLIQDWKAFVLYSVFKCVSKLAPFVCRITGEIKCIYKNLCQKRSVVFMCAGWISLPQRNPVCVLELYQLCFLMLRDLICPVLLLLALRLIFNMCFACASTTEPVCQMALRLGRRSMHNTLYLAAHCFSYSSGTKLGARASPLTTVPTVCNLFFTALFLTDSLNMSGK